MANISTNTANNQNKQLTQQQKQAQAARAERKRTYELEKQGAFKVFAIVIGALLTLSLTCLIITLTAKAVYVYAEGSGTEVSVSGSAFLKALFTNNYTSANAGYDDLAVPFYYYAAKWCQPAAIYTLLTFLSELIALLLLGLALAFAIWKKEYVLVLFPILFEVLTVVFASLLFKTCLDMKNGAILSTYCGGNPLCSIRSDVIPAAILSVIMLGLNVFAVVKYMFLQKKRKAIKG